MEFIRLATVDELQSTEITVEAMRSLERELHTGRVEPEVWARPQADPEWPQKDITDESEDSGSEKDGQPTKPLRKKGYTHLDDVPMNLHRIRKSASEGEGHGAKRQKSEQDPATLPFDKKRAIFQNNDYEEGLQQTKKHLRMMREKLQGAGANSASSSQCMDYVGDSLVVTTQHGGTEEGYEPILGQQQRSSVLDCLVANLVRQPPQNPFVSELRHGGDDRRPSQQASPLTRAFCPSQVALMPEIPGRMKRRLTDAEKYEYLPKREDGNDSWVWAKAFNELWRIHRQPRRTLFVPHPEDQTLPQDVTYQWFTGPRTTQIYVHGVADLVIDNWRWIGWNAELDLGHEWTGVTRFLVKPVDSGFGVLHTWLTERAPLEELWRQASRMRQEFQASSSALEKGVQWSEVFFIMKDAHELAETFAVHRQVPPPLPHEPSRGADELGVEASTSPVKALPTGKVRLELKWNKLTAAWQTAFEAPICDALDVYFKHDAVGPVAFDEDISDYQVLPSRFVLVNKADPRKMEPTDADLVGAKLKGRWVLAGHLDRQAGEFETEAPTASLLAHNLICWFAAQFQWEMRYGDISAAFLQGEYLPDQRRVLVATPRGYPDFVQRFLATKLPSGSRTDMLRLKKGGFGLAESPRMWFLKLKKTVLKLGGQEWSLIPGVFSFFQGGRVIAMVACHVDDIRMIGSTEAEAVWKVLKEEFSFGECVRRKKDGRSSAGGMNDNWQTSAWRSRWTSMARRSRCRGPQDLTRLLDDAELKWVGHVCGQLNWLARQCRGDLLFGVSRAQQLAGCKLPDALAELKILVERAREPRRCRFVRLETEFDQVVFLIASDASFGAMPRSRSQGGTVLMVGHPAVLEGQGTVNVLQFSSSLLKRVVKSSLAAEISQAAEALDDGDFLRAVVAAATSEAFALKEWMATVSRWKLVLVLDTKTGCGDEALR